MKLRRGKCAVLIAHMVRCEIYVREEKGKETTAWEN
jgi:hypothetical protein